MFANVQNSTLNLFYRHIAGWHLTVLNFGHHISLPVLGIVFCEMDNDNFADWSILFWKSYWFHAL